MFSEDNEDIMPALMLAANDLAGRKTVKEIKQVMRSAEVQDFIQQVEEKDGDIYDYLNSENTETEGACTALRLIIKKYAEILLAQAAKEEAKDASEGFTATQSSLRTGGKVGMFVAPPSPVIKAISADNLIGEMMRESHLKSLRAILVDPDVDFRVRSSILNTLTTVERIDATLKASHVPKVERK